MFEIIKQKPLIVVICVTLIGAAIGIVLSFTILAKYVGASDENKVINYFIGENAEEILPLTLNEARHLRWKREVSCVSGVGYYSRKNATKSAATASYSLIFDNQDQVIGIYLFSETQQQSPWEQMEATGPFAYPHWGLHVFFKNPSTACE